MNYNSVSVNFHQTFKPETQYIASLLELAGTNPSMTIKEISAETGIPNGVSSGKVEPHIQYASFMGLLSYSKKDGTYSLKRTELGQEVYIQDPGLQEKLTLLVCHGMILRVLNGAPVWSASFKEVLPRYHASIDKDLLAKELSNLLDASVTKKTLAPFFGCYDDSFSALGLVQENDSSFQVNSIPFEKDFVFLYAYILFEYWDEFFPGQDEISSTELSKLNFGKTFGWSGVEEYAVLERLNDEGLIRLNRQLMPFTILKLIDKVNLISKLYSELC